MILRAENAGEGVNAQDGATLVASTNNVDSVMLEIFIFTWSGLLSLSIYYTLYSD